MKSSGSFKKGHISWCKGKKRPEFSGKNHPFFGKHRTKRTKQGISIGNKGKLRSEETKRKMSEAHKGLSSPMKGKHLSIGMKKRISEGLKKTYSTTIHPMIGRHFSKESKEKMSKAKIGKYIGINHWGWKGGVSPLIKRIRHSFKYRQWRSDVFTRDDFTCQECWKRGGDINAHHIRKFVKIIDEYKIRTYKEAIQCEELWNINNGQTLCLKCHNKTKKYAG